MVLESIAAYGNLHFAGVGAGLSELATHILLFCGIFALYLYDVALWHRCLLYDGPGDVCWGLEKDFWAWRSSVRAQTLCALLNWSHWACLLDIRKFLVEKVCLVAVWSCCGGSHVVLAFLALWAWI